MLLKVKEHAVVLQIAWAKQGYKVPNLVQYVLPIGTQSESFLKQQSKVSCRLRLYARMMHGRPTAGEQLPVCLWSYMTS